MNFDLVAKPYEAMECIAFGHALERCRTAFLPELPAPARALLIGEGDGRFLQRFARRFPQTQVDVVEQSAAMIARAQSRDDVHQNIRFQCADILTADLRGPYDLVVTHFVLDVFTAEEVSYLAVKIRDAAPNGTWLISEFRICEEPAFARAASKACIWLMYAFFRVAAGVRVMTVPEYRRVLQNQGFTRVNTRQAWHGFLSSEVWTTSPICSPAPSGNR
jgi:trans-aconitate methyltransferase